MKILRTIPILIALFTFSSFQMEAFAGSPRKVTIDQENFSKLSPSDQQRVLRIVDRFEAIGNIDRSELTAVEKKELRNELKGLRGEAAAINAAADGTVIVISTTLLLLIIILILVL